MREPPGDPTRAKVVAVLTGDIIASSTLASGQIDEIRTLLSDCITRFRDFRPKAIHGKPEFFRGDAWQLLLNNPGLALRLSLLIRAEMRSRLDVDTRISIAIGGVEKVRRKISLSSGEAFTLSGRALDRMTRHFDLTGVLPDRAGTLSIWLPVILHLCSGLVRSWTRRQAEIISYALLSDNPTHEAIAESLDPPVSKQTVSESLASSNWRALLEPIKEFEVADWSSILAPQ